VFEKQGSMRAGVGGSGQGRASAGGSDICKESKMK
jgi:hypothetical protein